MDEPDVFLSFVSWGPNGEGPRGAALCSGSKSKYQNMSVNVRTVLISIMILRSPYIFRHDVMLYLVLVCHGSTVV